MIPVPIQDAISKAGGEILKCAPVCEGSQHYIVTFTAPPQLAKVDGAASFARLGNGTYRADFILKEI
jgi:hypothetical protein